MLPLFAVRQSLQETQDQFDLVEGNPGLAKRLHEGEERRERERKK